MRHHRFVALSLGTALLGSAVPLAAQPWVVDFENLPLGKKTPFQTSVGFHPVDFFSQGVPGDAFSVVDEFEQSTPGFAGMTGKVLLDANPLRDTLPLPPDTLTIKFWRSFRSIKLAFALNTTNTDDQLYFRPWAANVSGGIFSVKGTIPFGFIYPEGEMVYNGGGFDRVELWTSARNFAIDNVEFSTVVPEPTSLALVASGTLALVAGAAMRRRRAG